MKIILKTLHTSPRATTAPPPSCCPANATCTHEEGEIVENMYTVSADHHTTSCGSRKRPFSKLAGTQDHGSSLISSFHQSEALNEANGCRRSHVAKCQLGQANTSPVMQPQSGLTSGVKLKSEDVGEGPTHATGIQGTSVNPSIKEEPCSTNGTWCDHKTKRIAGLRDQPTRSIDVSFLQRVALAFEEVNANQEEGTRSAKESISMNPSLEPTFLAIVQKHGDITKDCPLESGYMLTSVLEAICKVVQELQQKHFTEFDCNLLNSYCSVVRDAEKMNVNVNWLRTRLDEIKDAVNCIIETKELNDEKNTLAKQIENEKEGLESMKAELEKLKSEIERKENLLNLDTLLTEDMSSLINDRALRIQQYKNMPLMEAFQ
ncbi:hypothetical protein FXO38_02014 [Capsicum annuum]|nr:uncharacterized protein LOC107864948 [Capsicum annuum]KAF3680955.1 hypothetical protein FXO38_02014 [Capsicum annuum]KAF3683041.1 hypothetical protein FXO37_02069 [Capsicum annuum]